MQTTDVDAEAFRMACVGLDELTVEPASLAAGTDQAQAERDALQNCIRKLEVDTTTKEGELRVIFKSVSSLKEHFGAGETHANTAEVCARKNLDMMSQLRSHVERLTWTVRGERARVAYLVGTELSQLIFLISAELLES